MNEDMVHLCIRMVSNDTQVIQGKCIIENLCINCANGWSCHAWLFIISRAHSLPLSFGLSMALVSRGRTLETSLALDLYKPD